jgi:hypothetical protein
MPYGSIKISWYFEGTFLLSYLLETDFLPGSHFSPEEGDGMIFEMTAKFHDIVRPHVQKGEFFKAC